MFKGTYDLTMSDDYHKEARLQKAKKVLSDSGANIAAAPTVLANMLGLPVHSWPLPKKIIFGNGASDYSLQYIDVGYMFGRVALLDKLVNTILAVIASITPQTFN